MYMCYCLHDLMCMYYKLLQQLSTSSTFKTSSLSSKSNWRACRERSRRCRSWKSELRVDWTCRYWLRFLHMSKFNELITLDNLFVLYLSAYLLYMQELRTDCKISTTRSKYRILVLYNIIHHTMMHTFLLSLYSLHWMHRKYQTTSSFSW